MKNVLILLMLVSFNALLAQDSISNLPPKSFYKRVNVTLNDFSKIECKDVRFTTDSIFFNTIDNSIAAKLALKNVQYVRVQNGHQVLKWTALGALLGCVLAYNQFYYYEQSPRSGQMLLYFTLSGAAIGVLAGSSIPRWKTYYLNY